LEANWSLLEAVHCPGIDKASRYRGHTLICLVIYLNIYILRLGFNFYFKILFGLQEGNWSLAGD
jgi:hypothetical protein